MFKKLAHSLEQRETSEAQFEESKSVINKVVDWCITNWYVLSTSVAEEKLALDIFKEIQSLATDKKSKDASSQNQTYQLLPIHELLPKKG